MPSARKKGRPVALELMNARSMFGNFYNRTLRRFFESGPTGNARIAVVGVGGGGGNAVNNMVQKGIEGVDFIAVNTDSQVLATNKADRCIQVGKEETGGG